MANKKSRRSYPVEWQESKWEQALWRPQATFHPILDLVEQVARDHGRLQHMSELVPSPQDIHLTFSLDPHGRLSIGNIETSDRQTVVLTHAIHRAMRELAKEEAARIIRQVNVRNESGPMRRKVYFARGA